MFAVQFALARGAQVIVTTRSGAKGNFLNKLGVHHVINYKEDEEWG
jgi:NADPH:quinone reductase-like Zn-dependent oxidoreductase